MSDKYVYPVCLLCGSELGHIEEFTVDKVRRITKSGKLSKREKTGWYSSNGISYLQCLDPDCNTTFYYDEDDEGRIVIHVQR